LAEMGNPLAFVSLMKSRGPLFFCVIKQSVCTCQTIDRIPERLNNGAFLCALKAQFQKIKKQTPALIFLGAQECLVVRAHRNFTLNLTREYWRPLVDSSFSSRQQHQRVNKINVFDQWAACQTANIFFPLWI